MSEAKIYCQCPAPQPGLQAVQHVAGCPVGAIVATQPCPACGAAIGEPCMAEAGWIMPGIHTAVRKTG